jgi:hypothetical protein
MRKIIGGALTGVSMAAIAVPAHANCDKGEIHIKFSHCPSALRLVIILAWKGICDGSETVFGRGCSEASAGD